MAADIFPDGEYYKQGDEVKQYAIRPCGRPHSLRLICRECVRSRDLASRNRKENPIIPHLREWIFKRDGNKCVLCDTSDDLTVDHVMPVVRGGRTDPDNLRTLCRSCNSRKGSRNEESSDTIKEL